MSKNNEVQIHFWCKGFRKYLERHGFFYRDYKVSEEIYINEIYSAVALSSSTTIWRVCAVCVMTSSNAERISKIGQSFFEYFYQANVIQQIILSDRSANNQLRDFLNRHQIIFINLEDNLTTQEECNEEYEAITEILFPTVSEEDIDVITSRESHDEFKSINVDDFLRESLFKSAIAMQEVSRFLPFFFQVPLLIQQIETEKSSIPSNSISIEPHFYAINHTSKSSQFIYIYPNKFSIHRQISSSSHIIAILNSLEINPQFKYVSDAIKALQKSIIWVCMEMLYGHRIPPAIARFREALRKFAEDDCLSILAEDFENKPFDVQEQIIQFLTFLNVDSKVSKNILLKGANSRVKNIAIMCISMLSQFGFREAIPLLQELTNDRLKAVRDAAEAALKSIKPRDKPFWHKGQQKTKSESNSMVSEEDSKGLISDAFPFASQHAFFLGPKGTHVHISLFGDNSTDAIATTYHENGTRNVNVGGKLGLFSNVARGLTGKITPRDDTQPRMGEGIIRHPDGRIEKISLSSKKRTDKEK
jgi:hypothetical protein